MYTYYKLFYNVCQQYFWYTSLSINSCEYLYSPFKKITYFFSIFLPSNQEIKYIYYIVLYDYLQDYKKIPSNFRNLQNNLKSSIFTMFHHNFTIMDINNLLYDKKSQTVPLLCRIFITNHIMWGIIEFF